MDDEFYELCYEAWVCGHSPDDVSIDEYDRLQSRGFSPEEISLDIVLSREEAETTEEELEAQRIDAAERETHRFEVEGRNEYVV